MTRKRLIAVVGGVILMALGAFFLASLATHDAHEGPFPDFQAAAVRGNACGVAGAYVSAYALALLGWAAYIPAAAVLMAGLVLVVGRRVSDLPFRLTGAALATVGLILGLAMANASPDATIRSYEAAPGTAGGTLGILLAGALYRGVGATGAFILFLLFCSLGLFLLAGAEMAAVLGRCARAAWQVLRAVGTLMRRIGLRRSRPAAAPAPAIEFVPPIATLTSPLDEEDEIEEYLRAEESESVEPELVSSFAEPFEPEDDEPEFDVPDQSYGESEYQIPPLSLLDDCSTAISGEDEAEIREKTHILERTLAEFKVQANVVRIQRGPVITMYELSLAPGTKVSKVESLADDLAISLKAPNVRIVAPLPGRNTVGIEVPNAERELVSLHELMDATRKRYNDLAIPLFLGKDTAGNPLVLDLASCPHLLVAGSTGSGKSVAINAMIGSILMTRTPDDVQLFLIDPKAVEFSTYSQLPHLLCPVLTDMKKAASVLKWACKKMDERYSLLSQAGVRDLFAYNDLGEEEIIRRLDPEGDALLDGVPLRMPHVVIIVDEFGELMMVAAKEVESSVIRLSQKARAVGIHLICATQRPSVDVITGLIKANLPARIAFQVSSKVDSRTILDRNGAELLLGRGDMLLLPPGTSRLVRAQGTYVSEEEIVRMVEFLESDGVPAFHRELQEFHARQEGSDQSDDLYDEAVRVVLESQRGSVSLLQRRLSVGYSRAARLVDMMAEAGIVGSYRGSQARRVLMTLEQWEKARAGV